MKMFRKQTARAPLITVLLVLLLALSIAASSIGFAAWAGGQKQFEAIDSQYTTIGILSGANYDKLLLGEMATFTGLDSLKFPDGTYYVGPESAKVTAQQSPHFISAESNILLSAHVADSTAITSGTLDVLKYNCELDDHCYSLSVFAAECADIEIYTHLLGDTVMYRVEFDIIDPVCLMDAYDLPPYEDKLYINTELHDRNGEIPFEVGKTYLIRGQYGDYPIGPTNVLVEDEHGEYHWEQGFKRLDDIEIGGRSLSLMGDGDLIFSSISDLGVTDGVQNFIKEKLQYPDSELCYWTTPEGCWPYFAEYEGDWRDYLETEQGRVWKEEIIPNFEMNHASATVILTDNLGTMYNFNTGDASILEGRSFEQAEYQNGDSVCLVSASYAKLNGYDVGDSISLDYYDTGFSQMNYDLGGYYGRQGITVQRLPLTAENRMDIQKDYTIVGIYTAPEWTAGQHSFHADTIFVPKVSVPGMDTYVGKSLPMLNTVTIQNGSIDAFEAHMASNDKAGAYLYFDQGYSEAAATVQTLIDNAMRLMMVGIAMFLLASMLFLLLFARRVSAVMRSMRLLGVPKRKTWLESLGMLVMQELIAVLLGNGLAVVLYDRITAQLLSGTPALDTASIALCACVQLALLVVAGGTWMQRIAGKNLMQNHTTAPKQKTAYAGA